LSEEQKGWLQSRREAGGFASTSDVVRDLIRSRQEQEQAKRLERFQQLDGDGSDGTEPKEAVLKIVKQVKKERRALAGTMQKGLNAKSQSPKGARESSEIGSLKSIHRLVNQSCMS
jgi:Arc/MetJ-type ribon-helix-helix transcriptional regulator